MLHLLLSHELRIFSPKIKNKQYLSNNLGKPDSSLHVFNFFFAVRKNQELEWMASITFRPFHNNSRTRRITWEEVAAFRQNYGSVFNLVICLRSVIFSLIPQTILT